MHGTGGKGPAREDLQIPGEAPGGKNSQIPGEVPGGKDSKSIRKAPGRAGSSPESVESPRKEPKKALPPGTPEPESNRRNENHVQEL